MLRAIAISLCAIATTTCAASRSGFEPLPAGGHHVLFVGNSLTYANDLPGTVAAVAASAGDTIVVAMAAEPNVALIDHVHGASNALDRIARERWELVVLQQGPTPAGVCRDTLVLAAKLLAPAIAKAGGTAALLMAWTSRADQSWFDDDRISYQAAATAADGIFLPAGEAWRAAWRVDAQLQLYGPDGYHPSALGTFLTALEIYERVTGHDARVLPAKAFSDGREINVDVATIRLLQTAAHDANTQFPLRSGITVAPAPPPAVPTRC